MYEQIIILTATTRKELILTYTLQVNSVITLLPQLSYLNHALQINLVISLLQHIP